MTPPMNKPTVTMPPDTGQPFASDECWMPADMAERVVREFGWTLKEIDEELVQKMHELERERDDDDNG